MTTLNELFGKVEELIRRLTTVAERIEWLVRRLLQAKSKLERLVGNHPPVQLARVLEEMDKAEKRLGRNLVVIVVCVSSLEKWLQKARQ